MVIEMSALGNKINELQKRILVVKKDLSEINKNEQPLPEFIDKANLLRSNEYLQRANTQKSKLIISYEEYTKELEQIISSVLEIKGNLNALKSRFSSHKKPPMKSRKKQSRKKIKKRKTKSKPYRRKLRKKSR
jgi:hypothetical protein